MCVIIDADVVSSSIRQNATEAGRKFLEYVSQGKLLLVLGGHLSVELAKCGAEFRKWLALVKYHKNVLTIGDDRVDEAKGSLVKSGVFESDDPHIVALAQLSEADLIYTNDRKLQNDCKRILEGMSVYSTNVGRIKFSRRKREQLDASFCTLS
ncbi:MAG: hypothetical protein OXU77_04525 [Gammaproteobacteria bacterium]|nr:hypothetical protein [Gammaproteobacteria bacterium]MDE0443525.1 hypothetical protein [Gammaproteobacteria bacterium]